MGGPDGTAASTEGPLLLLLLLLVDRSRAGIGGAGPGAGAPLVAGADLPFLRYWVKEPFLSAIAR